MAQSNQLFRSNRNGGPLERARERERERFGLCFPGGVKGAGALTLASREAASCGSGVRSSFCVTATQSRTPLIASNRF